MFFDKHCMKVFHHHACEQHSYDTPVPLLTEIADHIHHIWLQHLIHFHAEFSHVYPFSIYLDIIACRCDNIYTFHDEWNDMLDDAKDILGIPFSWCHHFQSLHILLPPISFQHWNRNDSDPRYYHVNHHFSLLLLGVCDRSNLDATFDVLDIVSYPKHNLYRHRGEYTCVWCICTPHSYHNFVSMDLLCLCPQLPQFFVIS